MIALRRPVPRAAATPGARTTPVATATVSAPASPQRDAEDAAELPTTPAPAAVEPVKATRKAPAAPLSFEAHTLVRGGNQQRERKSRLVLGDEAIVVRANDSHSVLYAVRYDEVLSISYSHGRDPLWNAPAGPRRVARAGGGFLGIFVEHDWISLH